MEIGKGVSPAYRDHDALFGLYFTFGPKIFDKR